MADDTDTLFGLLLGIMGGIAAAKLIDYLTQNRETPRNRYQVGVGTQTAASVVAQGLEKLTEAKLVVAAGEADNPDSRTYKLSDGVSA
jgi:hypothetical protein